MEKRRRHRIVTSSHRVTRQHLALRRIAVALFSIVVSVSAYRATAAWHRRKHRLKRVTYESSSKHLPPLNGSMALAWQIMAEISLPCAGGGGLPLPPHHARVRMASVALQHRRRKYHQWRQ